MATPTDRILMNGMDPNFLTYLGLANPFTSTSASGGATQSKVSDNCAKLAAAVSISVESGRKMPPALRQQLMEYYRKKDDEIPPNFEPHEPSSRQQEKEIDKLFEELLRLKPANESQ